jgi:hypothetical protein
VIPVQGAGSRRAVTARRANLCPCAGTALTPNTLGLEIPWCTIRQPVPIEEAKESLTAAAPATGGRWPVGVCTGPSQRKKKKKIKIGQKSFYFLFLLFLSLSRSRTEQSRAIMR